MQEAHREHNVPLDEEAFFLRATVRAEARDFEGAARDLTVCMDLGMLSNDTFLKRGEYLFRGGDAAAALEDLGVVLRRKSDSVPALRLRATVLLHLGRYHQAEADLDTLLVRKWDMHAPGCSAVAGWLAGWQQYVCMYKLPPAAHTHHAVCLLPVGSCILAHTADLLQITTDFR